MSGGGTGLIISHDIRNERYMLRDFLARAGAITLGEVAAAVSLKPQVLFRAYWWEDQGPTPQCTSASLLHLIADAPISHSGQNPVADRAALYNLIVEEDRQRGRFFSEGATMVAQMEVARRLQWIAEYLHTWTLDTAIQAAQLAPLMWGTWWYPSLTNRDSEGIVRSIAAGERPVGGHAYVTNGRYNKRGLWRVHQTWGDGYYLIPDEIMYRLLREEGECIMVTESKGKLPRIPSEA